MNAIDLDGIKRGTMYLATPQGGYMLEPDTHEWVLCYEIRETTSCPSEKEILRAFY